jgi:hypothetical protein
MMRPRLRCVCKTAFPAPQVRDRDTKLQHVIPSGPSFLPRLSCRARCARCCEERRWPCPQAAVSLLRLLPRTLLFPLLEACIPPQNEPSLPPCPCPHNYIHQQPQQPTKMPIYLIQQRSGIPVTSSTRNRRRINRPFLPSARTTHIHSTAQQPTKTPTYLHTTTFWNSDRQFHSGMVTESIIPPAPAAHNTIAFINPDTTDQLACLPTYLPTYLNILELW